jgi:hypothetical protein
MAPGQARHPDTGDLAATSRQLDEQLEALREIERGFAEAFPGLEEPQDHPDQEYHDVFQHGFSLDED